MESDARGQPSLHDLGLDQPASGEFQIIDRMEGDAHSGEPLSARVFYLLAGSTLPAESAMERVSAYFHDQGFTMRHRPNRWHSWDGERKGEGGTIAASVGSRADFLARPPITVGSLDFFDRPDASRSVLVIEMDCAVAG